MENKQRRNYGKITEMQLGNNWKATRKMGNARDNDSGGIICLSSRGLARGGSTLRGTPKR